MAKPLLRLDGVSKVFTGVVALNAVTMQIDESEICCLVGENGSGKSTLIKIIAGIYEPTSGHVEIGGDPVGVGMRPIDAIRAGIQVIHQDFALFDNLTVYENISFGLEIVGRALRTFSHTHARSIARKALDRMRVTIDLDMVAGELPMVDRQLVAIAAALVKDARLIIMDEPTTALSRREVATLLSIIRGLKEEGVSTLFVSHKLDEILAISDHIVVLRNGEKVADQPSSKFERSSLVTAVTGRDITFGEHVAEPIDLEQTALLELDSLSRTGCYEDVSLTLRPGEILGITGLLGSGRDTLALSLFGLLPSQRGRILIEGRAVELTSPRKAIARGIGYVPEDRLTEGLFLEDSVRDNIVTRTVYTLANRWHLVSPARLTEAARAWVSRLTIKTKTVSQAANTLSGGNQQRIVLARWLSGKPRILILNGPSVGVDVGSKAEILLLVRDLAKDGIGIIVVSDDIPELLEVCHRILLMKDGHVIQNLDRAAITESTLNEMLANA